MKGNDAKVLGFNHQTVNHSVNFVHPIAGVHTQHAESNWSAAKEKFKKMKGNTNPNFLQEYLKEFMWRRWHGEPHPNGFWTVDGGHCRTISTLNTQKWGGGGGYSHIHVCALG